MSLYDLIVLFFNLLCVFNVRLVIQNYDSYIEVVLHYEKNCMGDNRMETRRKKTTVQIKTMVDKVYKNPVDAEMSLNGL